MTAQELKMTAWEMDATASALEANFQRWRVDMPMLDLLRVTRKMEAEIDSLQAYVHVLKAEAAKEGAA